MRLLPGWLPAYRREWLAADAVAGLVVWSVVVPQAVAYAQIAGLPPSAGLATAPGALLAYALLGSSRALVVSATTATAAVSATAVGHVVGGDSAQFAALSAALALVTAAVLAAAGMLRLGGVTDFISKPVLTGFLFGLGVSVAVGQLPKLLGVEGGSGDVFRKLWHLLGELEEVEGRTLTVGAASIALLLVLPRVSQRLPATLIVLVLSIAFSKALDLKSHGVQVVGSLPSALPDPEVPDVGWWDLVHLLPAAIGIMLLACAEGIGVARSAAAAGGYRIDPKRELVAVGGSNLLAGLSSGFVQSGGASQTAAAESAGGRTQATSLVAAGLIVLTGAFLAPLFESLPQATLGAIVIVAVSHFWRVGELRRFGRISGYALVLALVALAGVLALGILPGLVIAAVLTLVLLIQRLSRPSVAVLARDPATGAWARADRNPDWVAPREALVLRPEGPLFYANAGHVREGVLADVRGRGTSASAVVLDLSRNDDLDLETVDMLAELEAESRASGAELRLAAVHAPAVERLQRSGLADRVSIAPTIDAAVSR